MRTPPRHPDDTRISPGADSDPTAEDWLAEEGDLDWGEAEWPAETGDGRRRGPGKSRLGRTGRSAPGAESRRPARTGKSQLDRLFGGGGWQGDVVMRRRIAGIAALVVVVVVAIVVALVASGGGKKAGSPGTTQSGGSQTVTTSSNTTPAKTTPAKTHSTPPASVSPIALPPGGSLSTGDKGTVVKQLQQALAALGYHPGKADGIFGPGTNTAVIAFQKKKGLKADGVVGPKTVRQINAALAALNATG